MARLFAMALAVNTFCCAAFSVFAHEKSPPVEKSILYSQTNQLTPKPPPPPHADIVEGYKAIVIQINDSINIELPPAKSKVIGDILTEKIKSAVKSTLGKDIPVILTSANHGNNRTTYPLNIAPEDSLFLQINFSLDKANNNISIGSLQPIVYSLIDLQGKQTPFYLNDFLEQETPKVFILDPLEKELGAGNALQAIANGFAIFLAKHRDYARIKNIKEPTF